MISSAWLINARPVFMPQRHLRQPEFTYSACGRLLKIKREKKFKETGDSRCQDIFTKIN